MVANIRTWLEVSANFRAESMRIDFLGYGVCSHPAKEKRTVHEKRRITLGMRVGESTPALERWKGRLRRRK